jgi:hypothetical protein
MRGLNTRRSRLHPRSRWAGRFPDFRPMGTLQIPQYYLKQVDYNASGVPKDSDKFVTETV